MLAKTTLVFALVCLIQGAFSLTAQDVVAEYEPAIKALQTKVDAIISEAGTKMGVAKGMIEKNIAMGRVMLNQELRMLQMEVTQAQTAAQTSGKDITACVDAQKAAVKMLDTNVLNECRLLVEFVQIQQQLNALKDQSAALSNIGTTCSTQFPEETQEADLRKCIETAMATAEASVNEQIEAVNGDIANIGTANQSCVNDALSGLKKEIAAIKESFNGCVAAAPSKPE